ncbi:hypothetical protein J6590_025125 [Homalodisca vitripennis]|nr:hypothetical protein J6590_025125 [Homalodisca vitripennis]
MLHLETAPISERRPSSLIEDIETYSASSSSPLRFEHFVIQLRPETSVIPQHLHWVVFYGSISTLIPPDYFREQLCSPSLSGGVLRLLLAFKTQSYSFFSSSEINIENSWYR